MPQWNNVISISLFARCYECYTTYITKFVVMGVHWEFVINRKTKVSNNRWSLQDKISHPEWGNIEFRRLVSGSCDKKVLASLKRVCMFHPWKDIVFTVLHRRGIIPTCRFIMFNDKVQLRVIGIPVSIWEVMLNYIKEFRGVNESILSKPSAPNAVAPRQDETSYWLFFNLWAKKRPSKLKQTELYYTNTCSMDLK